MIKNLIKKIGFLNITMLLFCLGIIIFAEYLFLSGEQLRGIFVGMWAPMLLGLLVLFNIIFNGDR